jgi:hypothetical protein
MLAAQIYREKTCPWWRKPDCRNGASRLTADIGVASRWGQQNIRGPRVTSASNPCRSCWMNTRSACGGWLKVHVTPAQVEWTIAGILALFGYSVLLWIVWRSHAPRLADIKRADIQQSQRDMIGNQQRESPPQRIGQTDLQIIIGSGTNYEKVEIGQNRVTKSVLIGVKNTNPNRYLSNCNLYVKLPNDDVFHPLNNSKFSLNQEEERFFEVAYRYEYINKPQRYIDSIQFSIPNQSGGAILDGRPLYWLSRGTHFITLKAEALEVKPYEIICKVWIDDNGTLRLAKA